jgi:hypothetical protein
MQSCVVVKEYDKLYINPDMKLAAKAAEKYYLGVSWKQRGQMEEKQVVDVVVIKIIKWKK